jgi:hypothetical protein
LVHVLKLMNLFISLIFKFFPAGFGQPQTSETVDTKSADMGAQPYILHKGARLYILHKF